MSGPANTSRTSVDLEEFEALLRRAPSSAPVHADSHADVRPDPLAELARLVEGQRLPFVKSMAPEQHVSADWDLRGPGYDQHSDMRGAYGDAQAHGLVHERAPEAFAPGVYEEDPYAKNLYSQPSKVPPPPPGAWRQEDAVWEDEVEQKPKSRKAIYAMGGALCVVLAGVAGTYAFRNNPTTAASAPTIKAASGPLKVVPEAPAPSGAASPATATVLDKSGEKIGASRVVSSEEQPVDLSQVRTASIPAVNAPARPAGAFPEPIKVKTVSVRPDGTIISPTETAARPTNPPIMPAQPQRTAANVTGSTPAAAPAPTPAPAPSGPAAKTTNRVAPPTEAPKPVQTAATTPAAAVATPGVAKGGFAVQLAAAGSEAEARDKIGKYQRQFASSLNGHAPGVVKGDVNGKAVWRIRVGGLAREDANSICSSIKDAGGACFVAAN